MNKSYLIWIALLLVTAPKSSSAEAGETHRSITGKISLSGKYDSDISLTLEQYGAEEQTDDIVHELSAAMSINHSWRNKWRLEIDVQGFGNWPIEHRDRAWYVGTVDLYLGYTMHKNTISLLNNTRYFSVPKDGSFDFLRNSATLAYKRDFSDLWEGRIGFESIANPYMKSADLNYFMNGGFVELRNTWTPLFVTYYMYGFLYYNGSITAQQDDMPSSPSAGYRHTGELGFDWLFARKNSLSGAYTFQLDNSEQDDWVQHGGFEGEEGALETDADFNFIKNKGTLLFAHRFNQQFSITLYNEFIHKYYLSRVIEDEEEEWEEEIVVEPSRTDLLFLTSTWITIRFHDSLIGKVRYIFRMNESTQNNQDYRNHIGSIGLEYRF